MHAASDSASAPSPEVSIIIPVYNEEAILQSAVVDLIDRLQAFDWSYELILTENGSSDGTVAVAEQLQTRFAQLQLLRLGEPNYGKALQRAIAQSRGRYVLCDEIDLCDTDFYTRALALLRAGDAELVVGSKLLQGASDERPFMRHVGSQVINGMLRLTLGFRGTDTHGLKAFQADRLKPVAARCLVDKDLFASELVIRAEREGVRIQEIPVRVLEKRPPSIHLLRRVPNVLKNLGKLVIAIRFRAS